MTTPSPDKELFGPNTRLMPSSDDNWFDEAETVEQLIYQVVAAAGQPSSTMEASRIALDALDRLARITQMAVDTPEAAEFAAAVCSHWTPALVSGTVTGRAAGWLTTQAELLRRNAGMRHS